MSKGCHFCSSAANVSDGVVDVGGLKLCQVCYETRLARTEMSCEVCGGSVSIVPDLLQMAVICSKCESKADLPKAWDDARSKSPCDRCKNVAEIHHATCFGQNLCHDCYKVRHPCTQVYRGDKGYPAFPSKPPIPAALLPVSTGDGVVACVSCQTPLDDPAGMSKLGIPSICEKCDGPKWWAVMDRFPIRGSW